MSEKREWMGSKFLVHYFWLWNREQTVPYMGFNCEYLDSWCINCLPTATFLSWTEA